MNQHQRNPDGTTNPKSDYPPIPEAINGEFFTGQKYEVPMEFHYWGWRSDYQRWGACVTFANNRRCVTTPRTR
jgi:hypothetical protein